MTPSRAVVRSLIALTVVPAGAVQGMAALSGPEPAAHPARSGTAIPHAAAPGTAANPVKAKATVKNGYVPMRLVVRPRQKVWFVSVDRLPHTATANKRVKGRPVFDNVPSAGTFTIRAPKAAGAYAYFCLVHPYQKGVLVVRRPGS